MFLNRLCQTSSLSILNLFPAQLTRSHVHHTGLKADSVIEFLGFDHPLNQALINVTTLITSLTEDPIEMMGNLLFATL